MIVFLYGTDAVRSARKLEELKAKFRAEHDPSGMNLALLDAAHIELGDLQQALLASPFLSTRRMVVVRGLLTWKKDEQESALVVLNSIPDSTVAVFYETVDAVHGKKSPLWEKLTDNKYHWEFAPLSGAQLSAWIQNEAKQQGVAFAPAALSAFMSAVGPDSGRAVNEIAKLAAYVGGEAKPLQQVDEVSPRQARLITPEDVATLVSGEVQENMFGFLDAVAAKSPSHAARLLEEQIAAGTEPMQLLAMIARTVRLLIMSRDMLDRGMPQDQIARELGVHPFAAKKSISQASKFDLATLRSLHARLVDADRSVKTGTASSPRVVLDLLVAKAVAA